MWRNRLFDLIWLVLGGLFYARYIEPYRIKIERLHLVLPRLHPAFEGYRVVQISDLHVEVGECLRLLADAVEKINALQPDIVVITGDFVTSELAPHRRKLTKILRRLQAVDGVLAVPGNHDYWTDIEGVRGVMAQTNIRDLSNTYHTLQRGAAVLHIAGLDDQWEKMDDLEGVVAALPDAGATILLAHEPAIADRSAATGRFDLQLSGHTHGGQFHFPFIDRPFAAELTHLAGDYPLGLYRVGQMWQYTNRGLGMAVIATRWNCPPEITEIILHSPTG